MVGLNRARTSIYLAIHSCSDCGDTARLRDTRRTPKQIKKTPNTQIQGKRDGVGSVNGGKLNRCSARHAQELKELIEFVQAHVLDVLALL